jgi:hypothetical protein
MGKLLSRMMKPSKWQGCWPFKEGLFVGMSSGAAVAGALHIAKQFNSAVMGVILPDRGDRDLSTTLFRSICAKCPPKYGRFANRPYKVSVRVVTD